MKYYIHILSLLVLLTGANAPVYATVFEVRDGQSIQAAVLKSSSGDTIRVFPGIYHETVYIDKNNIMLEGVILNRDWPVLDGKLELNDGILVAGHGVTVRRFIVKRYKGNAIMTQGANNFKILENRIEGPAFYGIFPQYGTNGLIAYNVLSGIEDAAIYVGMSTNVDVLSNEVSHSVMGIESENSVDILIEGNYVHDNTAGIIVSLLPGLPIKETKNTIVRRNFLLNNNTENFAPPSTLAASTPAGFGGLIHAADGSTWENNLFVGNGSGGLLITDATFAAAVPDPKVDPRPDGNRILANIFIDNGNDPKDVGRMIIVGAGLDSAPDVAATGKGRDNCISNRDAIFALGTENWESCPEGATTAATLSLQLPEPVPNVTYRVDQVGQMAYLAVCSACHTYSTPLIGPPMLVVKALYQDRPQDLADWIAAPTRKRPDYPEMPPQAYLPEDVRLAVAKYILETLDR